MNYSGLSSAPGKKLLAEEVFERIGQSIVEGSLAPGERIRDADLASEFNVSRMPIREALQRLERIGLVEMFPSRFTQVTAVSPEAVASALEFAGFLSGAISRMAVPRLTDEQRDEIVALTDTVIEYADDPHESARRGWTLFHALSQHSNNPMHQGVVEEFGIALYRNLREWNPSSEVRSQVRENLQSFRDAVLAGDGAAAERAARAMHLVAF